MQAADGYFRILGRVDDVINVAGHRLGTKEIESAALTVPEVAEAAAVPVIDDIRGRVVEVYVSLKPGFEPGEEMAAKVSKTIETVIGKIARPKNVWIVADMPKTRSGKIMRRVIASVSNFADVGDVTTLANPEVVESDPAPRAGGKSSRTARCRASSPRPKPRKSGGSAPSNPFTCVAGHRNEVARRTDARPLLGRTVRGAPGPVTFHGRRTTGRPPSRTDHGRCACPAVRR